MKIAVYDHGLNLEVALTLAEAGHDVGYFTPWDEKAIVTQSIIGSGFPGVERIPTNKLNKGWWQAVSRADLVCFFDTNSSDDVYMARQTGKLVWGAGGAEIFENDRVFAREMMERLGMPVVPYAVIKGVDALTAYLKKNKNKWVKLPGQFRGNLETYKHDTWSSTAAQVLGRIQLDFGAYASELEFVVEEPMEGVEVGWDGLVVQGMYSSPSMIGYEAKDEGYIGKVMPAPRELDQMLKQLSPFFRQHDSSTFFSAECRVSKDATWYLVDPCVRCPHPPTATELVNYSNVAEYITAGARGLNITIKPEDTFVAAVVVESAWAEDHWTEIKIDPKVRHLFKLQRAYAKDGKYFALPGQTIVGTAVGLGSTMDEAIEAVTEVADKVSCRQMSVNLHSLQVLKDEVIPEGRKYGINF